MVLRRFAHLPRRLVGIAVLALTAVLCSLVVPGDVLAQEPPPPVETLPTESGLGDCVEGMKVSVLNSGFNALPEDQSKRDGSGGFETFIVLNCKAYEIRWEILDDAGRIVPGGTGANRISDKFDEVEWVDLEVIEYQRHTSDVLDSEGNILFLAGDVVVDEDGNGIPATVQPPAVTAYRFKFEFANDEVQQGTEMVRPLTNNRDYLLKFDILPYEGAPNNHIHGWVFEIVGKLGGNWWQKIIRVLSPINWLEKGLVFLFQGMGAAVHGGMCFAMGHFMTDEERETFDRYDSNGDGRVTVDDDLVGNAGDPHKPNANGNCKKPDKSPREELEEFRTAAYIEVNDRRALVGLPPLQRKEKRDTYLSEVLDGRDPRSGEVPLATQVHYELSHITLAPRLVLERVGAVPPQQAMEGGITTFTGLLTGTPPELTYERGIVRIGWSALLNVMVAALALVIAWIGLSQVVRSFIGGQRTMADWRETVPRLILALIAALTSYWWCSLLVDVADGVSRYVAAAMRVTPADITLTLGNALFAIVARNVSHAWLAAVPVAGTLLVAIKVAFTGLIVLLMKIFAITVLLVIAQFVMRIVLLNLLIIISPLGMLMWALPETSGWGRRWVSLFMTTLFQHGIQIIGFAVAIWFVRLATPIGIIADTGSVNSALQAVLPTQMFWALLIGIMGMIVTFKVPSILGQGSLQESFLSTISFAALGFRALGFIAGGGSIGPLGFLGMSGAPGGDPATPGGLAAQAPVRGVTSGVTATASNIAAGAAVGGLRSLRAGFSAIRGAGSLISPEISAQPQSSTPSTTLPSSGDASEQGPEFTAERVTPVTTAGGPIEGSHTGTGTITGDTSRAGPERAASDDQGASRALTPREQHQADVRQVVGGIGARGYLRGRRGGLEAMSGWYVRENGVPRIATPVERQLIRDMGVGRFNRAFDARPAPGVQPEVGQGHVQERVPDSVRARAVMGNQAFERASGSGVRALNDNYVMEGASMRPVSPAERRVISEMGRERFNQVFSAPPSTSQPASISQRQAYFDARQARTAMGEQNFANAREGGLTALRGAYVSQAGQTRLVTPVERRLIEDLGHERFNRVFSAPPAVQATAGTGDDAVDPPARVAGGSQERGAGRPSVIGQMGQAFREGYSGYMEQARVPLVRDMDADRIMPETSEGHVARQTLGEEYWETAGRRIRYVGSGAWQNTGGAIRPLTGEQVLTRSVMGDEEFTRAMDGSIRTQGQRNDQGEYLVTENGEQRVATPAEARLISPDQLGVQGFNRAMGSRSQFMGEGDFIRDEGTTRIATENESRLLDQVGERRFNDVMGRRIEDAGGGFRVDAMPEAGEVLEQAGRDSARLAVEAREGGERLAERGRELAEEAGRTRFSQGLGDWGRSAAQELGGRGERPPYDAQRVENQEERQRYYGMRSPDE